MCKFFLSQEFELVASFIAEMELFYRSIAQAGIVPTPGLLSEWACIVPLACHLASPRYAYHLVGKAALSHRLSISLFPRLGVLKNIAVLLKDGPEFFDSMGSFGIQEVWDVNWGSTFPCANGSASRIISSFAIREAQFCTIVPPVVSCTEKGGSADRVDSGFSTSNCELHSGSSLESPTSGDESLHISGSAMQEKSKPESRAIQFHQVKTSTELPYISSIPSSVQSTKATPKFYRGQTLHILRVSRRQPNQSWYLSVLESTHVENLGLLVLLGCVILMAIFRLYATAVALFIGLLSKIACRFTHIQKAPSFFENNEKHNACMLVAAHRNATTWYLYIGDRGVVDHLLNKDMVQVERKSSFLSVFFKLADMMQIIAMTLAAAHKGWDAGAMVFMMLFSWFLEWEFGEKQLARQWLNKHGIDIDAKTLHFSRRTQMICAIQKFSGSRTTQWMDDIIAPTLRRDTLLEELGLPVSRDTSLNGGQKGRLSSFDQDQVAQQRSEVEQAVACMVRAFPEVEYA